MQACKCGVIHDTHQKYEPHEAEALWCKTDDEDAITDKLWNQ